MSGFTCQGYVLHRLPYRETSLLVDVLTLESGKLRVVAKGVRGSKSDRKSLLQPFQLLECVVSGRNELRNLGRVEALSGRVSLTQQALYCGFYLNELLSRALPIDLPHEEIFSDYQLALQHLAKAGSDTRSADVEIILRSFELKLLEHLGYLPDLSACAESHNPIEEGASYTFLPEQGFVTATLSGDHQAHSAPLFYGRDIIAMQMQDWHTTSLRAAKLFVRLALPSVIGSKPLQSRSLFAQVK
ncbi:DNA repair protein RecO [Alteromonas flava]|uniref:DNA repair protein RecO n=1 Tax=Alteromonas flava TaxID=2048003 RepID=UPI000C2835BC|nr:DNA repair protein RecO [Alteromonas flava]